MDDSKLEKGKWEHNQRVSHDKLIASLKILKAGLEDTISETEGQVAQYKQTLLNLSRPRPGKQK